MKNFEAQYFLCAEKFYKKNTFWLLRAKLAKFSKFQPNSAQNI